MKRTTVFLDDELAALVERERRRRGDPVSAIVRDALRAYLPVEEPRRPLRIAALGRSGHADTSDPERIDAVLDAGWGIGTDHSGRNHASPTP